MLHDTSVLKNSGVAFSTQQGMACSIDCIEYLSASNETRLSTLRISTMRTQLSL